MTKEIINAETSVNGKKARKSPVPANVDRVMEGALKMPLAAKIELRNKLNDSIQKEIDYMETQLNGAKAHFK